LRALSSAAAAVAAGNNKSNNPELERRGALPNEPHASTGN